MRKLIIFVFINIAFYANAQPVDIYKSKNNTSPTSFEDVRPLTFEDYIVQLAWQNSFDLEGSKYEINARGEEISLAKKDWTKNLQAGLNVNNVSFPYFNRVDSTRGPVIATYPLWNIGIGVNFGDLLTRKNKVKFADNRKKVSEAEMNFKKQKLKGEVLKRYQEYLSSFDIFKVRLQALEAAESNKNQIQSLFSVNKVQFEDYNTANKAYYEALENKVRGEADIKLRRIALEEILGVKWESVERIKASYEDKKKN